MRNSPTYTTTLTSINNFAPLLCTFIYIYIKNPFSLKFILLNRSIKGILIFIIFILLNLLLQTVLSPYS